MTYHFYATHNGKIYREGIYNGYSKAQAISLYKEKHGLKYKRDVKLYKAIGGTKFI